MTAHHRVRVDRVDSNARTDELIFEYACHEANYGLEGVLKGARFGEKASGR